MGPGDGSTAGRLLNSADLALYLAKTEGRGTLRFFEPEMDARINARGGQLSTGCVGRITY